MRQDSTARRVIVGGLAVIGVLALLAAGGMAVMHGTMPAGMGC